MSQVGSFSSSGGGGGGGVTTWSDKNTSFSAAKSNGYFVVGAATATLPASPSEGDTIGFIVDASITLTIQASGSQIIRLSSAVSSAGGTASNTLQGDTCVLVYRTSDTCWIALSYNGIWSVV